MAYGLVSLRESSFDYSSHIQLLSGLAPGTEYHFRVRSSNRAGVEAVSGDRTFSTLAASVGSGGSGTGSSCAPAPTSATVVSVKDTGARGDGSTNDTAAIQAAINQVAGTGGTVLVPDGTYMVDAAVSVKLGSNMTFRMTSAATLRAIPNALEGYYIVKIEGQTDVNMVGGTVQGERYAHTGPGGPDAGNEAGEWGMGVTIAASKNVYIEGVTAKECWGDGFYQAGYPGPSYNIHLCSVVADHNRRQGLSIENVDGMVVRDSVFWRGKSFRTYMC